MDFSDKRDLITAAQVVEEWGVFRNVGSVYRLCRQRKLPYAKLPGMGYVFSRRDIQAHLDECEVSPMSKAKIKGFI